MDWSSETMRVVYLATWCVSLAAVETTWPLVTFPRHRRRHYLPNLALTALLIPSNLALAALPTAAALWANIGLGAALVGAPLWCLAVYLSVSATSALLEHSNVAVPDRLDRWLRLVMVTPSMHKTHHSRSIVETNSNYSNIFSCWDRLFDSYVEPSARVTPYGLDGYDTPTSLTLRALLLRPSRSVDS